MLSTSDPASQGADCLQGPVSVNVDMLSNHGGLSPVAITNVGSQLSSSGTGGFSPRTAINSLRLSDGFFNEAVSKVDSGLFPGDIHVMTSPATIPTTKIIRPVSRQAAALELSTASPQFTLDHDLTSLPWSFDDAGDSGLPDWINFDAPHNLPASPQPVNFNFTFDWSVGPASLGCRKDVEPPSTWLTLRSLGEFPRAIPSSLKHLFQLLTQISRSLQQSKAHRSFSQQ